MNNHWEISSVNLNWNRFDLSFFGVLFWGKFIQALLCINIFYYNCFFLYCSLKHYRKIKLQSLWKFPNLHVQQYIPKNSSIYIVLLPCMFHTYNIHACSDASCLVYTTLLNSSRVAMHCRHPLNAVDPSLNPPRHDCPKLSAHTVDIVP